jgi:hypothetical protein
MTTTTTVATNNSDSNNKEQDSYYFNDDPTIQQDKEYINLRDNVYREFVVDIHKDTGGAIKITNTDEAVIFHPDDPAETYHKLIAAVMGLDKEFIEDPKLLDFTKRDLRWKLKEIYRKYEENGGEPIRHLISERPKTWVELRNGQDDKGKPIRRIQEFKEVPERNPETRKMEIKPAYGNIILDAVPAYDGKGIEIVRDPLFGSTKYRIKFEYIDENSHDVKTTEMIGPMTIAEFRDYLEKETNFVLNRKVLADRLDAIIRV